MLHTLVPVVIRTLEDLRCINLLIAFEVRHEIGAFFVDSILLENVQYNRCLRKPFRSRLEDFRLSHLASYFSLARPLENGTNSLEIISCTCYKACCSSCVANARASRFRASASSRYVQHLLFRFVWRTVFSDGWVIDSASCLMQRNARSSAWPATPFSSSIIAESRALKYELGVHIVRGFIAWLYGSKPGSVHDIEVTRAGGLLRKLLPGELILADKGYVGEDLLLTPIRQPVDENEWNVNRELSSVRIIVEHTIGRIKFFRSMSEPWRHELFFHHFVFRVICNLVNVDMMLAAPR